nr:ABC transporter substrate-binding protein [Oscillatoria laete-virens]
MVLTSPGWATQPLDKVRLKLKWKHQFQFAGYYAAIEKGFYREAGLEVELIEPAEDEEPMHEVLDGKAEFGVSTSDLILLRAEGHPVVALAVIYQHSPLVLLARTDEGISTLHDLVGKRLMIEPHSADLYAMFRNEGIPLDKLRFEPMSFSIEGLLSKKVDAISAYLTDEPFTLFKENIPYIQFSPRAYGIDFYGDGLFTTEEQIRKHPKRVKAFREASLRGWRYAFDNPEEIADLILAKYSQRKSREHLLFEAIRSRDLAHPDLVEIGYMNPGRWDHIAETFRSVGMLDKDVDLNGFLYNPEPRFPWRKLLPVLGVLVLLCAVTAAIAGYFRLANQRLQAEIQKRLHAESALKESEKRYREVYENAPLAFVITDPDLRIVDWNQRAEEIFGWTRMEAIGKNILELIVPPEIHETIRDILVNHRDSPHPVHSLNHNLTKNGQVIWCDWNNVYEHDDNGLFRHCLSIAAEVTDKVATQEALKAANQNLEKQAETLKNAKKDAEEATAAKSQFLAMMSHEIRTPLNAVSGYTALLRQEPLTPSQKEMVETVSFGAESLTAIVSDILDYSKIESGKLDLETKVFHLPELIRSTARLFEPLAAAKKVSFEVQTDAKLPEWIRADATRMGQILSNLLSNAVKFTDSGKVRLLAEFLPSSSSLLLRVEDTGIGMSAEQREKLFTPFTQADASISRRFGGTGLGLAITKSLIDLMHGKISAASQSGKGTQFTVTLPVETAQAPDIPDQNQKISPSIEPPLPTALNALVADDTQSNRKLTSVFLERLGLRCDSAEDGQEAVDLTTRKTYDMIFMDMSMPRMNGLEAAKAIRRAERDAGKPPSYIIALTANASRQDQAACLEAGMNDFLTKPLRIEDIRDAISRFAQSLSDRNRPPSSI